MAPQKSRPVDEIGSGEEKFLTKQARRLAEIDTAIGRARMRQKLAAERGDKRTEEIEAGVIDRNLRERFQLKPGPPSAADRWPAGRVS